MSESERLKSSEIARELGRLGASKGGKARAERLTSEERKEIAKQGAEAKWAKVKRGESSKHPRATHMGVLKIGDAELPCAVLEDGTRVFTQAGLLMAIGRSKNAPGRAIDQDEELPPFLRAKYLKPFISNELEETSRPILFRPIVHADPRLNNLVSGNRGIAHGYRVELLPMICHAYLDARAAGLLKRSDQQRIAAQCEILVRGLATVGIIALVDEATGYQADRARHALEEILERFISKELAKYVRTFSESFYENIFRLKGWPYTPGSSRRPVIIAQITADLVYSRLAPGVLEELRRQTPKDEKGRRKHKLFQHLTEDYGHPRLREHLEAVDALMTAFDEWEEFYYRLNRAKPQFNKTLMLPFQDKLRDKDDESDS